MHLPRPLDPVVTFRNSQGEAARGTLASAQRRSLVMEIYNPYSIVQVSEVLTALTVRSGDRVLYCGKAIVSSLLNTGLMAVVSVTLVDEWNELTVAARDAASIGREARAFVEDWNSRFVVRRDYQMVVSEMRAYFSEITRWVDQAEIGAALPRDESGLIRLDVFHELARPLLEKGRDYLARFEDQASQIPEEHAAMHRSFAQATMHPLILRAPFVYRTFSKPLGYAGDYEMVNQILGDPRQGPSAYFQLVNFMFLQAGVARAHRNRIDILRERLDRLAERAAAEGRTMRVLNIGCGPAVEIQQFVRTNPAQARLEFVLVDFNEETLAYAGQQLELAGEGKKPKLHLRHESVHQLLKHAMRDRDEAAEEKFDYVYCAGLFDYLTDKVCSRLIGHFVSRSREGAGILLSNVHSSNPERCWMEHFLEWYLIYRDEVNMLRLVPDGLGNVRTYTDSTGINVFLEATVASGPGSS